MRLLQLLVALAILTGIFGRRDALVRQVVGEFPAINGSADGSMDVRALPITLHDGVGIVTGIAVTVSDWEDIGRGRVTLARGRPNALEVDWIGGACDNRTDVFLEDDGGLRVTVDPAFDFFRYGGMCATLPVKRSLFVFLTESLASGDIAFHTVD